MKNAAVIGVFRQIYVALIFLINYISQHAPCAIFSYSTLGNYFNIIE